MLWVFHSYSDPTPCASSPKPLNLKKYSSMAHPLKFSDTRWAFLLCRNPDVWLFTLTASLQRCLTFHLQQPSVASISTPGDSMVSISLSAQKREIGPDTSSGPGPGPGLGSGSGQNKGCRPRYKLGFGLQLQKLLCSVIRSSQILNFGLNCVEISTRSRNSKSSSSSSSSSSRSSNTTGQKSGRQISRTFSFYFFSCSDASSWTTGICCL